MKKILFICLLLTGATFAYSQKFVVPEIHEGIEESAYANYEQELLSCQDWLETHAPTASLRKSVNSYVVWWASGTPDFKMTINANIVKFKDGNLLVLFLGGWAKKAIQSKYELSTADGTLAGLRTVIAFYNTYKNELQRDKEVEKFAKMDSKGTLEEYVRSVVE